MLAAWVVFLLVVARVLSSAALCLDRGAASRGRRRRFIWFTALALSVCWPVVAIGIMRVEEAALARGWGLSWGDRPMTSSLVSLRVSPTLLPQWLDITLLLVWSMVSAALLVRLVLYAFFASRRRRRFPIVEVDGVTARLSNDGGPAVSGPFAMEIVVPGWIASLDASQRRMVLMHEVEHRDAGDVRLLWLAAILVALMPWNFVVWWQATRLRLAIEMDCDARVLDRNPCRSAYARLLVQIAFETNEPWSRLSPAFQARPSHLECRLAALSARRSHVSIPAIVANVSVAVLAIVVALAIEAPVSHFWHR